MQTESTLSLPYFPGALTDEQCARFEARDLSTNRAIYDWYRCEHDPKPATFTFETFSLDKLHDAYRAAGMEGTPAPAQTWGVGAPIPCNIHFVIGRGYVECGR